MWFWKNKERKEQKLLTKILQQQNNLLKNYTNLSSVLNQIFTNNYFLNKDIETIKKSSANRFCKKCYRNLASDFKGKFCKICIGEMEYLNKYHHE